MRATDQTFTTSVYTDDKGEYVFPNLPHGDYKVWAQAVGFSTARMDLTLGGAHGIFKGSRLEQLFRDGAIAEIQPPPSDFCLWNIGLHELDLDPAAVMPPMRPV